MPAELRSRMETPLRHDLNCEARQPDQERYVMNGCACPERQVNQLQAALTEALENYELAKKLWINSLGEVATERDALQQRVEACLTELHYIAAKEPGPQFDPDCPVCKKEAALRGEGTDAV